MTVAKPRHKGLQINDAALPFKLTAQPLGVQKAYRQMTKEYGATKGRQVFLAKAQEKGTGNTIRQKVVSVYHTGAKLQVGPKTNATKGK